LKIIAIITKFNFVYKKKNEMYIKVWNLEK